MKVAVFIPVRTKSTRLPNKALLEIKGKPIIEHLIERVKLAKSPDLIVICTTVNPEDEILVSLAQRNSIGYFQGSEKDILDRYLKAALKYKVDFIVNVDGDDIFCDPEYMDKVIELFVKTGADFIKCEGLPFGAAPAGIKVEALKKVCQDKAETGTDTGFTLFFTEGNTFHVVSLKAEKVLNHPEIRMSLDYPEDLEFFKAVFERLYLPGKVFSLREIISLLRDNPEIININKNREEEYWQTFNKKAVKVRWKSKK